MKKIRVWVVLLLTIVTLGIYGIVWLVKRRSEMVKNYNQNIPHWAWLIVPQLVLVGLVIALILLSSALHWNGAGTAIGIVGIGVLAVIAAIWIEIWWMVKFAKAAAYVVNGRMTTAWIIVLYIFVGGFVGLFLQYYFNRSASPTDRAQEAPHKPSQKFVVLASICIVLSLAGSTATSLMNRNYFNMPTTPQSDAQLQKANQLLNEYNSCAEKLGTDYPKVTADNETAYNTAYDACEAIRVEQNKAATDYNKSLQQ